MKYYVFSYFQYGNSDISVHSTKEEALKCVAANTGEDTYCRLICGTEVMFKITQVAEEVVE
jgi:hypothetical protein